MKNKDKVWVRYINGIPVSVSRQLERLALLGDEAVRLFVESPTPSEKRIARLEKVVANTASDYSKGVETRLELDRVVEALERARKEMKK